MGGAPWGVEGCISVADLGGLAGGETGGGGDEPGSGGGGLLVGCLGFTC